MPVTLDISGAVATIRMDDGKANAFNFETLEALDAAFTEAAENASAIVWAGRDGMFSGGFDLKVIQDGDAARAEKLFRTGGRLALRLVGFPKPVVAAAAGHGVAMGAVFLLAADYRVGGEGAYKFGFNETAAGIPLPAFAMRLAEARMTNTALFEAMVASKMYAPAEAKQVGLLDDVRAPGQVVEHAQAVAALLAQLPQEHFATNKRLLRADLLNALESLL
ncbi:MAG: crotonase/enoyl-CoA hydratase family protein [Pseudomonadota bacterium]